MSRAVTRLAPAKVNLYLGIHAEKDERGYHRADSVMAALALCDEVTVGPADRLRLSCDARLGIAPEANIAWRAAELLGAKTANKPLVNISIRKRIPSQAGLGGGSSDAAAVLLALCELWGVAPGDQQVYQVARSLGADVPFFLRPVPTWLNGAGDAPAELFETRLRLPVALVQAPETGVPTPAAYAEFDRDPPGVPALAPVLDALRAGERDALVGAMSNNLGPVAERLRPTIGQVRRWLAGRPGVRRAMVSGSGGCVFGICASEGIAERAAEDAARRGWWSCATSLA